MVFQRKKTGKSTALSVRAIAAQVILQVLDQGKSLSTLIPEVQSQVKPQDLPLLQEITFGICRLLPRLENIIKKLLDKPLKGKTRIVHCLLLVGLYQLLYMRVPAHAAVDEVVNATKSLKSDSFRGLVNGCLLYTSTDAHVRKRGEQTGLDTLVVHAVNDVDLGVEL